MNFRRYYIPNAIVFITNVVNLREPIFANETYLELFRSTLRNTQKLHPFDMIGYVFLWDHMHLLLRPTGASNFSQIMHSAKSYFTYSYKQRLGITGSMKFWQKRFYDHIIRDEEDFANHLHYIHYNPVKHGYVTRPEDWPHSSFLTWKQRGAYPDGWGWSLPDALTACQIGDVE
ncbi:MAG: transposase [Caldilinea sp. CFX5]|nr:transposase [Caldilinea sp. CFX5]